VCNETCSACARSNGQIWCISHVGGLEDAADKVIAVELSDTGVASLG
jgi:DNA repair exonuclease SbcCD ATPase subunit